MSTSKETRSAKVEESYEGKHLSEEGKSRSLIPILDPGDLSKATGACAECQAPLKRIQLAFEPCDLHPEAQVIVESPGSSITTGVMNIHLNPLNFWNAEKDMVQENGLPTSEDILKFCCGTSSAKPEKVVARYQNLHEGTRLQALPKVDYLDKKIVAPLLQAQSCYLTGNYLATIALCGTVGEMLANFAWEIYLPYLKVNDKEITSKIQEAFFDSQFEELPQKGRIRILYTLEIISKETADKFNRIRDVRNNYVHFHKTNSEEKTQKMQAAELFSLIQELVCIIIGQDFSAGKFNLNQATFAYLQRRNLISPFAPNSQPPVGDSEATYD